MGLWCDAVNTPVSPGDFQGSLFSRFPRCSDEPLRLPQGKPPGLPPRFYRSTLSHTVKDVLLRGMQKRGEKFNKGFETLSLHAPDPGCLDKLYLNKEKVQYLV